MLEIEKAQISLVFFWVATKILFKLLPPMKGIIVMALSLMTSCQCSTSDVSGPFLLPEAYFCWTNSLL